MRPIRRVVVRSPVSNDHNMTSSQVARTLATLLLLLLMLLALYVYIALSWKRYRIISIKLTYLLRGRTA